MTATQSWTVRFSCLLQFVEREGHSRVPASHEEPFRGTIILLGRWVAYMRSRYRDGALNDEQVEQFESLPGWEWNPRPGPLVPDGRDEEILESYNNGWSMARLALHHGLSRQRIKQIIDSEKLEQR